jgi:cytochrome c biogenesis protein CcmG/thiol:disulfide interchange protein DsbE
MTLRRIMLLCLTALLTLTACHKKPGLQIGDPVPSVSLKGFDGHPVKLPDDFKGKVVLVRFWSLDCGFCDKTILASLDRLYQKYKDQGFIPVAINESRIKEGDERLKPFEQLTYPMLADEYNAAARQFGVIGLPTTFIFDEQGILRDKLSGEAKSEEFEKLFTTVLNKGGFYENAH